MRGNKLFLKISIVLAMLCLGVASIVVFPNNEIKNVQAEDTSIYKVEGVVSQKYNDDIIFSAEHVYYLQTDNNNIDGDERTTPLYYTTGGKNQVSNILGYETVVSEEEPIEYSNNNYFSNYYGWSGNTNKKLVYDGDYVMVSETQTRNAFVYDKNNETSSQVSLNQGIMLTLGGYVYQDLGNDNYEIHTNSETYNKDTGLAEELLPDGSNASDLKNYSAKLQYAKLTVKHYDSKGKSEENAKVVATAERTFDGNNFDVVCFIDAKVENEGYYEVTIEYIKEGGLTQNHSFGFYMLMESSYDKIVEVESNNYSVKPTIENYDSLKSNVYSATTSGYINAQVKVGSEQKTVAQYPVLTYDCKHYDLSYTYSVNDSVYNVDVNFEQDPKRIVLVTTGNGITKTEYYDCDLDNDIVSLVFVSRGKYDFNFQHVYYFGNEKLEVSVENLQMTLTIDGYELKYAKTGYTSSDFRKLTVVKNGTTVVPVNGYVDSNIPTEYAYTNLGYMYEYYDPTTSNEIVTTHTKSGTIVGIEDGDTSNKIQTNDLNNLPKTKIWLDESANVFTNSNLLNYHNTDQTSLWFETNNYYSLSDSYYLYSQTPFVDGGDGYGKITISKVTTFSRVGYYFVKIGYSLTSNGAETISQYFAFRISSSTANVKLYTCEDNIAGSDDEVVANRLYSNQYTNKQVFAVWEDTTTFESKQTISIIKARQGQKKYIGKEDMIKFANGGANTALVKTDYNKREILSDSGSYLIMVSIEGKQSKAYYYFTIDKDAIAGIEVLAVESARLGNKTIYMVKQDESGTVTYTGNAFINEEFTMWWNDKESGADITAKYSYTPFVYSKTDAEYTASENGKDYKYVYTDYVAGTTSGNIDISKPATKTSMVESEYVLGKAGIYWFTLEDEAGNVCEYAMVYDNTPTKISAKSYVVDEDTKEEKDIADLKHKDTVSTNVRYSWGSHKGILLNGCGVQQELNSLTFEGSNYYQGENSNLNTLNSSIKNSGGESDPKLFLAVANKYAELNITSGYTLTLQNNGQYNVEDGDDENNFEVVVNDAYSIKILIGKQAILTDLYVYGENIIDSDQASYFSLTLNPDRSKGQVRATVKGDEDEYDIWTNNIDESAYEEKGIFNNSQASNGLIYAFEWLPGTGTENEVSKVYYEYHSLMTQEELNESGGTNNIFYPYSSVCKEVVVYDYENNIAECTNITRESEIYYRAIINNGPIIYYDANQNLVNETGTLPGLYVITRVYKAPTGNTNDNYTRKYAFIVDRNQIIDYSTSDITKKTVGEYINLLAQKNEFNSFNQEEYVYEYGEENQSQSVNIYLESNKLPLEIKVPIAKYVSYKEKQITETSYSMTGKLTFSLTFIDTHNYLGIGEGLVVELYVDKECKKDVDKDYISYSLARADFKNKSFGKSYLDACMEEGGDWLSLPGIYVITIKDNVGIKLADGKQVLVENPNTFKIGVEISQDKPTVNFQEGQKVDSTSISEIDKNGDTNISGSSQDLLTKNNADYLLTTSKAYVKYELPKLDESSFDAQIDSSYILITRTDKAGNVKTYYNSANPTDVNAVIQTENQQLNTYEIEGETHTWKENTNTGTTIWLDTGLLLENGKVTDYQEYTYTIKVRYVLEDEDSNWQNCYIYNNLATDKTEYCYESTYLVNIDRTASEDIVKSILDGEQESFIENYYNNYSSDGYEESQTTDAKMNKLSSNIYNTVALRGEDDEYYFGIVNKLYYYYVEQGDYESAENSMYAISVDAGDEIQKPGDTRLYYRELYFDNATLSSSNAKRRMALLPITSAYYGMNPEEFVSFNINSTSEFGELSLISENTWGEMLGSKKYYEIIEVDENNNFMQYVVYISDNNTQNNPTMTFVGVDEIKYVVNFNYALKENEVSQITTSGSEISSLGLVRLENIADMFGNVAPDVINAESTLECKDWYYYVKIASETKSKDVYVNLNNINIAEFLGEMLLEYGNYTLTITNRYNQTLSLYITNSNANYTLNYLRFKAVLDNNGSWYIAPKENLNTRIEIQDENNNVTSSFNYYASVIILTELKETTDENETIESIQFDFNQDGKVIKVDGEDLYDAAGKLTATGEIYIRDNINNTDGMIEHVDEEKNQEYYADGTAKQYSKIYLKPGYAYKADITDCYTLPNKVTKTMKIHAYDDNTQKDEDIEFTSKYVTHQEVQYTAGEVVVKYNKDSSTFPTISIMVDGQNIAYDKTKTEYPYKGKTIISVKDITEDEVNYKYIYFHPYESSQGLKIEYTITFNFEGEENVFKFVIDNRSNKITIHNNSDQDRSDIIEENYKVFVEADSYEKESLYKDLYNITPSKTLPETAIVSWDVLGYHDDMNTKYFNSSLTLIKFNAYNNYEEKDLLKDYPARTYEITPRQDEIGKYVILMMLIDINNPQSIVYYKAYAFNISTTSTSLYEVVDIDNNEIRASNTLTGEELLSGMSEELKRALYSEDVAVLTADDVKENSTFRNSSMLVYISNKSMNVTLSGGSVDTRSFEFNAENANLPGCKIIIYKIFSTVYHTHICLLQVDENNSLLGDDTNNFGYVADGGSSIESLMSINSKVVTTSGNLRFFNHFAGGVSTNSAYLDVVSKNTIYLDIYYRISNNRAENQYLDSVPVTVDGNFSSIHFSKAGSYEIFLRDLAGNTRKWNKGTTSERDYFTLTILPTALIRVNNEAPIEYAYYNEAVKVDLAFTDAGFYDEGSWSMKAYYNGSSEEYITTVGGRNTNLINSFTFTEYGTYRVEISAKHNQVNINRTYVFSILNPNEARIGLDFTTINNYHITKVVNNTTGLDVTNTFNFLLNEAYIYSKLITYERLASNEAFGATMGKQQFVVYYEVQENELLPKRTSSFKFTINNQTPSLESSLAPGKSTTKKITIKFNPLTIYRQVGDCYIDVNGTSIYDINERTAVDGVLTLTLSEVNTYYVRLMNNSNRVMSSFKVTIKEPLNTWSIILIVGVVLLVIGVIVVFIIFRTRMKVR